MSENQSRSSRQRGPSVKQRSSSRTSVVVVIGLPYQKEEAR